MLVEHTDRSGRKRKYCSNPECADARPVRTTTEAKTAASAATKVVKKTTVKKTTTRKKATPKA